MHVRLLLVINYRLLSKSVCFTCYLCTSDSSVVVHIQCLSWFTILEVGVEESRMLKSKHSRYNRNKLPPSLDPRSAYVLAIKSSCLFVDSLPFRSHNQAVSNHVITSSLLCEACCRFIVGCITFAKRHRLDKKISESSVVILTEVWMWVVIKERCLKKLLRYILDWRECRGTFHACFPRVLEVVGLNVILTFLRTHRPSERHSGFCFHECN